MQKLTTRGMIALAALAVVTLAGVWQGLVILDLMSTGRMEQSVAETQKIAVVGVSNILCGILLWIAINDADHTQSPKENMK
ncbi:hypothetical protein ACOI1H_16290 [Loktanella sp. DJP18]|uniref:hypothetical protein n=1 Tax=Loktanella sp. DJP18 TaxID=3409788 RepID=UPI003BB70BA9